MHALMCSSSLRYCETPSCVKTNVAVYPFKVRPLKDRTDKEWAEVRRRRRQEGGLQGSRNDDGYKNRDRWRAHDREDPFAVSQETSREIRSQSTMPPGRFGGEYKGEYVIAMADIRLSTGENTSSP